MGLVVRRAEVPAALWPEAAALAPLEHVEVGWGDGDFYPAPRGTLALALTAAFASRASVLHVAAFDGPVADFFTASPVVELRVSPAGFLALCRFVGAAYARDPGGRAVPVAPALYGAGGFFRARERYHLLDNSNHWAARALAAAGVPVVPALSPYAGHVLVQVARVGVVRRAPWPAAAGDAR